MCALFCYKPPLDKVSHIAGDKSLNNLIEARPINQLKEKLHVYNHSCSNKNKYNTYKYNYQNHLLEASTLEHCFDQNRLCCLVQWMLIVTMTKMECCSHRLFRDTCINIYDKK